MESLARKHKEAVYLTILNGEEVLFVARHRFLGSFGEDGEGGITVAVAVRDYAGKVVGRPHALGAVGTPDRLAAGR